MDMSSAEGHAMLFIPVSFVAAVFILPAALLAVRDARATGPLLPAFLGVLVVLTLLHGLRWGYGVTRLMPLQVALALCAPPLAYLALTRLGEPLQSLDLRHAVLPLAALVFGAIWSALYDLLIPALAIAYALMVARVALQGPDGLPGGRLSQGLTIQRALWACAAGLALSGITDAVVGIDFAVTGGLQVGLIISASQMLGLLLVAAAISFLGFCAPQPEASEREPAIAPSQDDFALAARLEKLIKDLNLHLSPDLTLNRLARRAHVPARQVSQAINRVKGESVSRFLNRLRVDEACRLLAGSDETVTSVMLSAGFQTKSNFNRAFKEITGSGPAEWRMSHRRNPPATDLAGQPTVIDLAGRKRM
jgi:AraC-like DNA-binding protein